MLRIEKLTRGRWGNKLLHYNTLMQLSKTYNIESSCGGWDTDNEFWWDANYYFDNICQYKKSNNPVIILDWKDILKSDFNLYKFDENYDYIVEDYCMSNVFFKITKLDPREFLRLKNQFKVELKLDYINVGIHFRGGDKHIANPREIHSPEYYIDSIKLIEKEYKDKKIKYYVCTDDKSFNTYLITTNYLIDNNLNWQEGSDSNKNKTIQDSDRSFIYDFSLLSECDILINSSSFFCVCSGFIGKKDKKIIHSKEWIDKNLKHEPWHQGRIETEKQREFQLSCDNFWVDLYNRGNEFYKLWKII